MNDDDVVGEWLALVQADLDGAWSCAHGERPSLTVAAYHLQQAAEKLIKAMLVAQDVDPPHTHDLRKLVPLLTEASSRRFDCSELIPLTKYAYAFRYPREGAPERIPDPPEIDQWVARIERLEVDFEDWLGERTIDD